MILEKRIKLDLLVKSIDTKKNYHRESQTINISIWIDFGDNCINQTVSDGFTVGNFFFVVWRRIIRHLKSDWDDSSKEKNIKRTQMLLRIKNVSDIRILEILKFKLGYSVKAEN